MFSFFQHPYNQQQQVKSVFPTATYKVCVSLFLYFYVIMMKSAFLSAFVSMGMLVFVTLKLQLSIHIRTHIIVVIVVVVVV